MSECYQKWGNTLVGLLLSLVFWLVVSLSGINTLTWPIIHLSVWKVVDIPCVASCYNEYMHRYIYWTHPILGFFTISCLYFCWFLIVITDLSYHYQILITDLDWACEMLQCGTHLLKDGLSKRTVEAGNERVSTHLTTAQVCFHVYSILF